MARTRLPGFRPRQIPPVRHVPDMRRHFPGFAYRGARVGVAVWVGTLQPSDGSPEYLVEVRLPDWGHPRVFVRRPALVEGVEHVYVDGSLCLYHPADGTWDRGRPLSEVVALTAAWLWFYEDWLLTGRWLGPEVGHGRPGQRGRALAADGERTD
jgi:hypothetical protein